MRYNVKHWDLVKLKNVRCNICGEYIFRFSHYAGGFLYCRCFACGYLRITTSEITEKINIEEVTCLRIL